MAKVIYVTAPNTTQQYAIGQSVDVAFNQEDPSLPPNAEDVVSGHVVEIVEIGVRVVLGIELPEGVDSDYADPWITSLLHADGYVKT